MTDFDFYWVYKSSLMTDHRGRTLMIASDGDARYIARYTRDGFPDRSFGFDGKIHFGLDSVSQSKDGQKPIYLRGLGEIRGTAFGPKESIFLTGSYDKRGFIAKLNSRGFPVSSYGRRGVVRLPESGKSLNDFIKSTTHARATGIGVRNDGSAVVTGTSRPVCRRPLGCRYPLMLKRVLPNGTLDRKFGSRALRGLSKRPDATGSFVHFDGNRIIVTGSVSFAIERHNFMIARFR
jgi:hypothetical protein